MQPPATEAGETPVFPGQALELVERPKGRKAGEFLVGEHDKYAREGLRIILYAVPFPDVRRMARISVMQAVHAAYMRACIPRRQGRGSTVSRPTVDPDNPRSPIQNLQFPASPLVPRYPAR